QEVVDPVDAPEAVPADPQVRDAEDVVLVGTHQAVDRLGSDRRVLHRAYHGHRVDAGPLGDLGDHLGAADVLAAPPAGRDDLAVEGGTGARRAGHQVAEM